MKKCIICGKDFEAKRADAKLCSPPCRQKAARAGIKLRGPNAGISPLTPKAAAEVVEVPINSLKKGLNIIPEAEIKQLAETAAKPNWIRREIPKMPTGLTALQQMAWKAANKVKNH